MMLAWIDPDATEPHQVRGWFDTEFAEYPSLPPEAELLRLTREQWAGRMDTPFVHQGVLVPAPLVEAPPNPRLTWLEFLARFTDAEKTAIVTAAQTVPSLMLWLITGAGASYIDLTDQQTKDGLDAMVAAGLVSTARSVEVLTP